MYTGFILDVLFLFCALGGVVSAACGYEKVAWVCCCISSGMLFVLPLYVAADADMFLAWLSTYFQPRFARDVLNLMLLIMLLAAIVGTGICSVTGIKWLVRQRRVHA